MGAAPAERGDLRPTLVEPAPVDVDAGLPFGTVGYCTGVALAMAALAGAAVSGVGVAVQTRLPEVMAASYGSGFSMRPAPPVAAPGGGRLHADLGSTGDRETYATMLSTLPPSAGAARVARTAQEWRLAVCDYRPRVEAGAQVPFGFAAGPRRPTAGGRLRVLDLTNMWAGPLATWLLQSLGAAVTKVEPAFRPDGFRALDGRGIHPDGRPCDPGRDSAMWNALNQGKTVVDLDLREAADRRRFLDLAAGSDVVIDSFSPRVMPNFGLDLPEGPMYVSMPAFPAGPERDWVAYGTGVHAVSGLGDTGTGGFAEPAVSYPDPVAGFTAALAVMAGLRDPSVARVECPLASAVQPLLRFSGGLEGGPIDGRGAALLEQAGTLGLLAERPVCGRPRAHPNRVFEAKQNVF
jgi:hypothetical protein